MMKKKELLEEVETLAINNCNLCMNEITLEHQIEELEKENKKLKEENEKLKYERRIERLYTGLLEREYNRLMEELAEYKQCGLDEDLENFRRLK